MVSLRDWIERFLPWYDAKREEMRDASTARIVRRSEEARSRAERVIREYQSADEAASHAGDRLIDEVRRK